LLPLVAIALAAAFIVAMGWHRQLSFETLVRHHAALADFIAAHKLAAALSYAAIYVAIVTLSIPAGAFMTIAGGTLFGPAVGTLAAVTGATIGAVCLFLIARSALSDFFARRAGSLLGKLAAGFRADAFNYLLFLRLVPLFPFFVINIVPALCGVRLGTFIAATAIGIIPGALAYAFVGAGLASVIEAQAVPYGACLAAGRADCRVDFDLGAVITTEVLVALVALGMVALLPVLLKRFWRRSPAADQAE
jgi:uncharacterized membrane protein YdjX (TVP38/TMEM64 family)